MHFRFIKGNLFFSIINNILLKQLMSLSSNWQQVMASPLNNSIAKQHYSIPKASRFGSASGPMYIFVLMLKPGLLWLADNYFDTKGRIWLWKQVWLHSKCKKDSSSKHLQCWNRRYWEFEERKRIIIWAWSRCIEFDVK